MTNKNIFVLLLIISISLFSSTTKRCNVKYQTGNGWSQTYNVNVKFLKGTDFNKKSRSFDYNSYSTYAVFTLNTGGTTIIETDLSLGLNQLDTSCNGSDQDGVNWHLDWSGKTENDEEKLDKNEMQRQNRIQQQAQLIEQQRQLLQLELFQALLPTDIYFENNTDETIFAAICYYDANDTWQTEGWLELNPEEKLLVAKTHNRYFYIYAHNSESTFEWTGTDYYDFVKGSKDIFGFTKCDIGEETRSFTHEFTNK
jgi:uncharacterized membrane protein